MHRLEGRQMAEGTGSRERQQRRQPAPPHVAALADPLPEPLSRGGTLGCGLAGVISCPRAGWLLTRLPEEAPRRPETVVGWPGAEAWGIWGGPWGWV